MGDVMMSFTTMRLGCKSEAATFVTKSRSVTIPVGFPCSRTTRLPMSRSRMIFAASEAVVSAGIAMGVVVMISTTGMRARMATVSMRPQAIKGLAPGGDKAHNHADNVKARALVAEANGIPRPGGRTRRPHRARGARGARDAAREARLRGPSTLRGEVRRVRDLGHPPRRRTPRVHRIPAAVLPARQIDREGGGRRRGGSPLPAASTGRNRPYHRRGQHPDAPAA